MTLASIGQPSSTPQWRCTSAPGGVDANIVGEGDVVVAQPLAHVRYQVAVL